MSADVLETGANPFIHGAKSVASMKKVIEKFYAFQQKCYLDFDKCSKYCVSAAGIPYPIDKEYFEGRKQYYKQAGNWTSMNLKEQAVKDKMRLRVLGDITQPLVTLPSKKMQKISTIFETHEVGKSVNDIILVLMDTIFDPTQCDFLYEYWKSKQANIINVIGSISKEIKTARMFDMVKPETGDLVESVCDYLTNCLSFSILQYFDFVLKCVSMNAQIEDLDRYCQECYETFNYFKDIDKEDRVTFRTELSSYLSYQTRFTTAMYAMDTPPKNLISLRNSLLDSKNYSLLFESFQLNMRHNKIQVANTEKLMQGIVTNWTQFEHNPTNFIEYWKSKDGVIETICTHIGQKITKMTLCNRFNPKLENTLKYIKFYLKASLALWMLRYLENLDKIKTGEKDQLTSDEEDSDSEEGTDNASSRTEDGYERTVAKNSDILQNIKHIHNPHNPFYLVLN